LNKVFVLIEIMSNNSDNSGQKAKSEEEDELMADEGTSYLQEMNKLKKTSTKLPELPIVIKPIKNKGFELKEEIGKGQFSTVYRAIWTGKPGVDIACKQTSTKTGKQIVWTQSWLSLRN
jgi:hypothetical protein